MKERDTEVIPVRLKKNIATRIRTMAMSKKLSVNQLMIAMIAYYLKD